MAWLSRSVLCMSVLVVGGCQMPTPPPEHKVEKTTAFQGVAMVVPYKVTIGSVLDEGGKKKVQGIIDTTFQEIDAIYNRWNPDSEVSHLNAAKAHQRLPVSLELETFLERTGKIVAITEGRFDPTVEPVLVLWKGYLEKGNTPPPQEVAALASAVGWSKIHLEDGVFWKDDDRTALDLGGVAKGYAIDLLAESLIDSGYPSVYVEWGGDIRTAGYHPDGREWRVAIAGLGGHTTASEHTDTVTLCDQAIATSGDYLQFWKVSAPGGSKGSKAPAEIHYFHVINPFTLQPMQVKPLSVASASVRAKECMLADGLATALMVFDSDADAEVWAENLQLRLPDVDYWIIARKDKVQKELSE